MTDREAFEAWWTDNYAAGTHEEKEWAREGWQAALASERAKQAEPVAWSDLIEQRLLTWRQRFVNRSGDQLALDDFMDKQSIEDLIDFVCAAPPADD